MKTVTYNILNYGPDPETGPVSQEVQGTPIKGTRFAYRKVPLAKGCVGGYCLDHINSGRTAGIFTKVKYMVRAAKALSAFPIWDSDDPDCGQVDSVTKTFVHACKGDWDVELETFKQQYKEAEDECKQDSK